MYQLKFYKRIIIFSIGTLVSCKLFKMTECNLNIKKIYNRDLFFFPYNRQYMSITKDEKNNIIKKGMMLNNKKHGPWIYVYDGYTVYEDYVNGDVNGEHKVIDNNNNLVCVGRVKLNQMISQKLYNSEGVCVNLPENGDFVTYKIETIDKGKSCGDILIKLHVKSSARRVTPYHTHLLTYNFDKRVTLVELNMLQ